MNASPPITIFSSDAGRLERLLDSPAGRSFPGRREVQAELDRAGVVEPRDVPPGLATMNSAVRIDGTDYPPESAGDFQR